MDCRRFRINAPAAVSEDIDGEAVIMNLESGHYFSARGLAGVLWQATIAGAAADDMVNAVTATWNETTVAADVRALLEHMLEHKLVVPTHDAVSTTAVPALERALKTMAQQLYVVPVIDVFTDMEDLLLLDPIHDVGEAGWPMPVAPDATNRI